MLRQLAGDVVLSGRAAGECSPDVQSLSRGSVRQSSPVGFSDHFDHSYLWISHSGVLRVLAVSTVAPCFHAPFPCGQVGWLSGRTVRAGGLTDQR